VTTWQAIVGKFLASWLFLTLALALTFPVWITVNWLGSPDNGVIVTGYIGSALLAGAYLAISCMTSAMTRSQVISVMTHFESFQRGVNDMRDVVFFASLIGFALFTTGIVIRGHRSG